jgi:hypothetical protein
MQKKWLASAAIVSAGLLSVAQPASAREFADIYTQCGLGAMIAPNNTAVAAVTNVTWDLGTTAISSDASSPESCKGGQAKKAAFIHETYKELEMDIARGEGQHLTALMTIAGCKTEAHGVVAQQVRADFAQLMAAPGYSSQSRYVQSQALYERFNTRVSSDFAQACSI